ncbi:MAG: SRPBCC domain-containing protein [Candidatus Zixiibacteriota bacterium]
MKDKNCGRYVKDQSDKILRKEMVVSASLADVWNAWTTTEGVQTFFSPSAKVELSVGGPYEIYFLLDQPYGLRGSEGCRILGYLPTELLSFEWNAPPDFGELRNQHTIVVLQFQELEPGKVRVILSQLGWGKGEDWDRLYDYFDKAWSYVLTNLQTRFTQGPIHWSSH